MKHLTASPVSDFEYTVYIDEDSKAESCVITKYTGTSGTVVIPDTLGGVAVKRIAGKAFAFNDNLISLAMPDSVTEIECGRYLDDIWWEPGAFDRCKNLTTVVLSNNLTHIGGYAFYYCASLININLPEGITFIGEAAFSDCASLTNITLPNTIIHIDSNAFFKCASLMSITIPDSVESIGGYAFYGCNLPTEVVIPDKVTCIGSFAFSECSSLISISISDCVAKIEKGAFKNCSKLKNVNIPAGLTELEYEVFDGCASLTSLTIPAGVTEVDWRRKLSECENLANIFVDSANTALLDIDGVLFSKDRSEILHYPVGKKQSSYIIPDGVSNLVFEVFHGCKNLKDVTVPNSVEIIDARSYYGCKYLVNIHVVCDNPVFSDADGILYDKKKSKLIRYPAGKKQNVFAILEGVIRIDDYSFNGCENLESILISESVTDIGSGAFQYCEKLKNIAIPKGVTNIGAQAFMYCKTLTRIIVPDSVTDIGERAYAFCTKLTEITLSNGITKIDERTFEECISLASITIPNNVTLVDEKAFSGCVSLESVTIGSSFSETNQFVGLKDCKKITNIFVDGENTSFSDADGVLFNKDKSVLLWFPAARKQNAYLIPNSVTRIGYRAFFECKNLENIVIPDSVTEIGYAAFNKCENLTDIIIPDSVACIKGDAFFECNSITEIFIPGSVTQIDGDLTFGKCGNLINITVDTENAILSDVDGILFDKDLTVLIRYPAGKTQDTYVIPDNVTQINARAFFGCKNLTSIVIPSSVTTIHDWAFSGCDNLTDITIPSNAENISKDIFGYSQLQLMQTSLTIHTTPGSAACDFAEKNKINLNIIPNFSK